MMDQLAILIITLPLTYPIVTNLGFGPVWFGIIIVKTIEIGLVTPPLGMNVYIASGTLNMDPITGFKGAIRFLPTDIVIILLLLIYPDLIWVFPT
jgi:TRAP-type C4-dicarboxylate transport system permease large subunit